MDAKWRDGREAEDELRTLNTDLEQRFKERTAEAASRSAKRLCLSPLSPTVK